MSSNPSSKLSTRRASSQPEQKSGASTALCSSLLILGLLALPCGEAAAQGEPASPKTPAKEAPSASKELDGAGLAAAIEGEKDAGKRAELLGLLESLDSKQRRDFLKWASKARAEGKRLKYLGPAIARLGDSKAAAALGAAARASENEEGSSRKALEALASMPASVAVPELLKGSLQGSRPQRRWHREELGRVLARGPEGVRSLESAINEYRGRQKLAAESIATEVVAAAIGSSKKARSFAFKLENTRSAFLARALAQGIARRPELRRSDPAAADVIRAYVQALESILQNHQDPAVLIDVFKTYRRAKVPLTDTWAHTLIDCLADQTHNNLKRQAWVTLKIMTGQNLRQSKAEWDAWWKSQSAEENP